MPDQTASTKQIEDEALSLLGDLMDAEGDLPDVVAKVNAWLRQAPAHRMAFAQWQRASRLVGPFLRATEPDASTDDINDFLQAVADERCRMGAERSEP